MSKIIVAYDGSDAAQRAVDRAAKLAGGNELIVLNVLPVLQGGGRGGGIDPTSSKDEAKTLADEGAARAQAAGANATGRVAVGHPADAIIGAIEELGADLVIIGSRGVSGINRWIMGSVSQRVVEHAPCDVLVVR